MTDDIELSLALSPNPRTEPVLRGDVKAEGIRFRMTTMHPSEMFWRQLKFAEFDVSEMSVSSLLIATSQAPTEWVAIPVFTMRHFFHTSILVRKAAGIDKPAYFKGKRIGVPEYQQTWAVWGRGILNDEFGVAPSDMLWFMERNPEQSHGGATNFSPPPGVRLTYIPRETNMGEMMVKGELDATLLYLANPNLVDRSSIDLESHPDVRTLFPDPALEAKRYYAKTGFFPINHAMVVRRSIVEKHPWVPLNVLNMMTAAKEMTNRRRDLALEPYVDAGLISTESRAGMATDPMPYGVRASRGVLENIARYLYEQGLAKRLVGLEENLRAVDAGGLAERASRWARWAQAISGTRQEENRTRITLPKGAVMIARRLAAIGTTLGLCILSSFAAVAAPGDPYNIDVILPITGTFAFIGSTHQKELTALEGIVNKRGGIQGRPVHFVFHDDTSNPEVSRQIAQAAIAAHPAVVLGSSLGALCQATTPLFLDDGPVNYCFSPVIPTTKGSYVFSASVSGRDLILATIRYFHDKGWKKIATLNTTDASGQIGDRDIAYWLGQPEFKDMTLVESEHFSAADTSVSAQVAKIKSSAPQAIIVWAPGTAFGTALQAITNIGLNVPVATTSANMIIAQMKSYAAFVPKVVLFQGVPYIAGAYHKDSPAMASYAAAMKDNGMAQDFQTGIAWDPAMIVIDALRKLGPNATAAQLRTYLEGLHDYVGIAGTYDFRDGSQRGLRVDSALIMRWDADKNDFVSVSKFGGVPL